jgi:hypothetical protein
VRRCGELLKQIEPKPGSRTDRQPSAAADTRFGGADKAGLSKRQAVTALRVASVPKDDFEAAVESETVCDGASFTAAVWPWPGGLARTRLTRHLTPARGGDRQT